MGHLACSGKYAMLLHAHTYDDLALLRGCDTCDIWMSHPWVRGLQLGFVGQTFAIGMHPRNVGIGFPHFGVLCQWAIQVGAALVLVAEVFALGSQGFKVDGGVDGGVASLGDAGIQAAFFARGVRVVVHGDTAGGGGFGEAGVVAVADVGGDDAAIALCGGDAVGVLHHRRTAIDPDDDLGTGEGGASPRFGEAAVVALENADGAEVEGEGFEGVAEVAARFGIVTCDRRPPIGCDAGGGMGFQITVDEVAVAIGQECGGLPLLADRFDESGDGIDVVLFGEVEEQPHTRIVEGDAAAEAIFGKGDQVRAVGNRLLEVRRHALHDRLGVVMFGELNEGDATLITHGGSMVMIVVSVGRIGRQRASQFFSRRTERDGGNKKPGCGEQDVLVERCVVFADGEVVGRGGVMFAMRSSFAMGRFGGFCAGGEPTQ